MPEQIQCEFCTHERFALGYVIETLGNDGYVTCECEADIVLQPEGMTGAADRAKTVFCSAHGEHLVENGDFPWEKTDDRPEDVRPLEGEPERAEIPNFP